MGIITITFKNGQTASGYHNGKVYNGGFVYLVMEGFKGGKRFSVKDIAHVKTGLPWQAGRQAQWPELTYRVQANETI